MRSTRMVFGFLGLVAWTACLSGAAQGQEEDYRTVAFEDTDESAKETGELRGEVTELRAQLKHSAGGPYEGGGGGGCGCGAPVAEGGCGCGGHIVEAGCGCDVCGGGGGDACCGCGDCCCNSGGFVGGAEVAWLKPHNSGGTGYNVTGEAAVVGVTLTAAIDTEFEATPRFWAGYQTPCGLGFRARYWEFDHDFTETVNLVRLPGFVLFNSAVTHAWDTYTFDAEVFDNFCCDGWSATWSAGFRYVEYEELQAFRVPPVGALVEASVQAKQFTGIGATAGLEFRRQVTDTIGVFANTRASILMGDEDNLFFNSNVNGGAVLVTQQRNDVKHIFEIQVGGEWTQPICGGGYYFARAGAEMQYWDNFGVSATNLFLDESAGFGGFFASVGINR